jgi:hypothetical protein
MFLSHSRFVLQSIPILRRKNVQNYKFLPLFLLLNLLISGGGGGEMVVFILQVNLREKIIDKEIKMGGGD